MDGDSADPGAGRQGIVRGSGQREHGAGGLLATVGRASSEEVPVHPEERSADLGYDLVHEEVAAPTAWEKRHRPADAQLPRVGGKADPDEDLGYDEAHDL